ncbi:hypothetical protein GCM10009549_50280 [Streptomyces thermoalcalitolerans]|uniref:Protein kinase domain-containing protein n=1 Tax=Streptomyces thermoalcalitolerans TaxID=65605 RepID=A0ABP4A0N8_9ACTN
MDGRFQVVERPGSGGAGTVRRARDTVPHRDVALKDDDPASGLWSLGLLLHMSAEGVSPLRRATALAALAAVLDDPVPPPVRSGPLTPRAPGAAGAGPGRAAPEEHSGAGRTEAPGGRKDVSPPRGGEPPRGWTATGPKERGSRGPWGQRRRRWRAMAAAVPPATAPTPAAAGMPTLAALRPVR